MDIVDDLRDLNSMHTPKEVSDIGEKAADEIERLRERLKRANENHEHFQREWYLRGDKIERLRSKVWALLNELQRIADVSERWEDSLVSQINEMAHQALKEGK